MGSRQSTLAQALPRVGPLCGELCCRWRPCCSTAPTVLPTVVGSAPALSSFNSLQRPTCWPSAGAGGRGGGGAGRGGPGTASPCVPAGADSLGQGLLPPHARPAASPGDFAESESFLKPCVVQTGHSRTPIPPGLLLCPSWSG